MYAIVTLCVFLYWIGIINSSDVRIIEGIKIFTYAATFVMSCLWPIPAVIFIFINYKNINQKNIILSFKFILDQMIFSLKFWSNKLSK